MTTQPFYLVDAFTTETFKGNPAAVCPLTPPLPGSAATGLRGGQTKDVWPDDALLQAMTIEHNQSETAFFVKRPSSSEAIGQHKPSSSEAIGPTYDLRWFTTSDGEIDLCGHATLASAHVIFTHIGHPSDEIIFHSRFSGELRVKRSGDLLTLDFPSWPPMPMPVTPEITAALGLAPLEVHVRRDYLFLLENEKAVQDFVPDFGKLAMLNRRVCITAPGGTANPEKKERADFVSRFFCPGDALDEDPVTGSAHSMLTPFWAARLGKTRMTARQLSARGGELICEIMTENPEQAGKPATTHLRDAKEEGRVHISGRARTYLVGEIFL